MASDPFTTLGLSPSLDLDEDDLEARYLRLSRDCHPDFNQGLCPAEEVAMLARAANLNDAYRALRDRWRRVEALLAVRDPGAMDATKTLCPMFLMEAMEIREAVEAADDQQLAALRATLTERIDGYYRQVESQVGEGALRAAATLVHQSNYYRKALKDLKERIHAA